MAGMLPGVECARRRRLRQSGGWSDSPATAGHGLTRRSSFCLYASNNECHFSSSSSSSSSMKRSTGREGYQDEKLGGVAREAKERLDERLRAQRKSENKRNQTQESFSSSNLEGTATTSRALQTEVFGLKKSGSRRFNWAKLRWKATDQYECAICLEQFKVGETLVNLPCAHRFHSKCLAPWLQTNSHCPCCRMGILN